MVLAQLPTTGNTALPRHHGYDAALDELLLRFSASPNQPLDIVSAERGPDRVQTEQTAEDYMPAVGDVFSRNNFTGGDGLDFAHRSDLTEADTRRYWDSESIDISLANPGEVGAAQLLRDTEELWAATADTLPMARLDDGTLLFADGDTVYSVADPDASGIPTRTAEDPHTGTEVVTDLATLGDEAYAAAGTDGIGKRDSAGTWSNLASATTTVGVWGVKGRIISDSGDGTVAEINTSDGTPTTLITLASGVTVNDVVDGGQAILVATSDGSLYVLSEDGGSLVVDQQTRLNNTDVIECMAHASGRLVVGTSAPGAVGRIYSGDLASSQSQHVFANVQLLKELSYIPQAATATRDRIYVAVQRSATEVELWRYQLATASTSRDLLFTVTDQGPSDLIVADGKLFVSLSATGIWRETSDHVASGWLMSPMADFFNPASKAWVGLTLQAEKLGDDGRIAAYMATDPDALLDPDSSLWKLIGTATSASQINEEWFIPAIRGRHAAMMFRLTAGAGTPRLISFALRAYADNEDLVVQMPVNVSDQIEPPNRKPFHVKGWGHRIYAALRGYDGAFVDLELYRLGITLRGVVEQVAQPVLGRPYRGSVTLSSTVTFRGRILASSSSQSADGTLGVKTAGIWLAGT